MTRSRKGSGFGGMRLARCPRCSFVFRKSARQIASGDTRCRDLYACERRASTGRHHPDYRRPTGKP